MYTRIHDVHDFPYCILPYTETKTFDRVFSFCELNTTGSLVAAKTRRAWLWPFELRQWTSCSDCHFTLSLARCSEAVGIHNVK